MVWLFLITSIILIIACASHRNSYPTCSHPCIEDDIRADVDRVYTWKKEQRKIEFNGYSNSLEETWDGLAYMSVLANGFGLIMTCIKPRSLGHLIGLEPLVLAVSLFASYCWLSMYSYAGGIYHAYFIAYRRGYGDGKYRTADLEAQAIDKSRQVSKH